MKSVYCRTFSALENDPHSQVFEVYPDVFSDSRGSFSEVLKHTGYWPKDDIPLWFSNFDWMKQVNRSVSVGGTIRGCHAQKAPMCQGKLVEALTDVIYDIITDARPESDTFGVSEVFVLDPMKQNKLWVPRGFLHSFAVPLNATNAVFQYFCDNIYSKEHEIGINPMTVLPKVVQALKQLDAANPKFEALYQLFNEDKLQLSQKDTSGLDYVSWMESIQQEFKETGKIWHKDWK